VLEKPHIKGPSTALLSVFFFTMFHEIFHWVRRANPPAP